jgi:hypothetical protein
VTDPSTELADALRDALAPRTSLVHPSYRHLGRPVTIAGLNRAQWAIGLSALALIWAFSAVAPLSAQWALSIGGTLVGVPASLLFVLSADGEFSVRHIARGVRSWRRTRRVLLPADPAQMGEGYTLLGPAAAMTPVSASTAGAAAVTDLWS